MKSYLAHLTSELIRFPSIDVPGNEKQLHTIISWVEKKLKRLSNIYLKKFIIKKKPALLVSVQKNIKNPRVFLNGHLDVVPALSGQFHPKITKDKLFGRGAQDMKGACAVMIALIEHFSKTKTKPDVGFMFVTDEEAHGDQSKMFYQKGYRPDLFIALEPSGLELVIETKGILWMEGTILGTAAHGSMPWLGKSPVEIFHHGLQKFYKKYPPLIKEKWQTTFNIGEVKSGDCYNRIPPSLSFKIDIRYVVSDHPQKIIQTIKTFFPNNTKWHIERCDPPHPKAKDMSLIKNLQKTAEAMNIHSKLTRAPFCTDARFFAPHGIPSVVFGAKGANMHGLNEWVDLNSLEKLFEILKRFIGVQ